MMEIVVKIPDDMIKSLEQGNFGAKYNIYDLVGYLMNGTPLPKHGRLIDENDLKTLYELDDRLWWGNAVREFTDLPTILEADKEVLDENSN